VPVVDADSDSSVLLLYGHNIRHPLRVVANFEEPCVDLLDNLLFDAEEKAGTLPP
ncbi:hypothetical protein CRG98_030357, partial [Punica granatum]